MSSLTVENNEIKNNKNVKEEEIINNVNEDNKEIIKIKDDNNKIKINDDDDKNQLALKQHGLKIVMISDTHNMHRKLNVPSGDVLIHAGDFTTYGKEEHAIDFNDWLGALPHKYKIIVLGNHESNSSWNKNVEKIISNGKILRNSFTNIKDKNGNDLLIYGTDFYWPCPSGNPIYNYIPNGTNILISHGPVFGKVDKGLGCPSLLNRVKHLQDCKLIISGHIH